MSLFSHLIVAQDPAPSPSKTEEAKKRQLQNLKLRNDHPVVEPVLERGKGRATDIAGAQLNVSGRT